MNVLACTSIREVRSLQGVEKKQLTFRKNHKIIQKDITSRDLITETGIGVLRLSKFGRTWSYHDRSRATTTKTSGLSGQKMLKPLGKCRNGFRC